MVHALPAPRVFHACRGRPEAHTWLATWDALEAGSGAHVVECCNALHSLLQTHGYHARLLVASFVPLLVYVGTPVTPHAHA